MKYIMLQAMEEGPNETSIVRKIPIIFSQTLDHDMMAEHALHQLRRKDIMAEIVSAGFITLPTVSCFGQSEALGVGSKIEDAEFINEHFM